VVPQPTSAARDDGADVVAALASFIFLPLSQALIAAHGWRTRCSPRASWPPSPSRCSADAAACTGAAARAGRHRTRRRAGLRSQPFWL
jgi:hypothetical protein